MEQQTKRDEDREPKSGVGKFSEHAAAMQALSDESQELRYFARSANNLSRELGHDFKNLLMIIACHAEIIERHTDNPRILDSLKKINEATHRATDLTAKLSTLYRSVG